MTYVIFSQKCQFRLTNENFEISRNSPELYLVGESLVLNSTDRFSRQTTCCGMNRAGIFFFESSNISSAFFSNKKIFLSICEMIHLWWFHKLICRIYRRRWDDVRMQWLIHRVYVWVIAFAIRTVLYWSPMTSSSFWMISKITSGF